MSDLTNSNTVDANTNDENANDENTNNENTNDENTNDENTNNEIANDENTNNENANDENTNDENGNYIEHKEFEIECPLCKKINNINNEEGTIFEIPDICMVCNKNNINLVLPNCNHFCICLECSIVIRTINEKYK